MAVQVFDSGHPGRVFSYGTLAILFDRLVHGSYTSPLIRLSYFRHLPKLDSHIFGGCVQHQSLSPLSRPQSVIHVQIQNICTSSVSLASQEMIPIRKASKHVY